MRGRVRHSGFSLTEVLLAVGTLAIGMIFIGGTFLTGIYFSTLSTERTIAALVADEAFAKIRLYGIDPTNSSLASDQLVSFETLNPIQVTVFISRKIGSGTTYPPDGTTRPVPVQVGVSTSGLGNQDQIAITTSAEQTYINNGSIIVDNRTGLLYRVMQRTPEAPNIVRLDKTWYGQTTDSVWVVPPPVGGGRNPCIAVYQKLISF
jgi:hypothetical protein